MSSATFSLEAVDRAKKYVREILPAVGMTGNVRDKVNAFMLLYVNANDWDNVTEEQFSDVLRFFDSQEPKQLVAYIENTLAPKAEVETALGAASLFGQGARPVYVQDAAELLHFAAFPPDSVMIVISRSGESAEIVRLLAKARKSGTIVIGLTNSEAGTLTQEAQIPVVIPVGLDHAISVNTYSTLAAAAAALASATLGSFDREVKTSLMHAANKTEKAIPGWREQISDALWPVPQTSYYFLARGSSLASCHEARLLWEEGVKCPATAMGTGSFRHGPQEMVTDGFRFGMWIDGQRMCEEDLAVARDLGKLGASVMVIRQNLREDAGDLVLQIPAAPAGWQFLFDIIPAQMAAERLARLSGVDCDSFRICSYIVQGEHGLIHRASNSERNKELHRSELLRDLDKGVPIKHRR